MIKDFNINRYVYISLKYKYIYIDIPKNNSTKIKNFLFRLELLDIPKSYRLNPPTSHCNYTESPLVKPYQLNKNYLNHLLHSNEFIKFFYYKDPIERVLSAYLDKIITKKSVSKRYFEYIFNNKLKNSFCSYVNYLKNENFDLINDHFQKQTFFIKKFKNLEIIQKNNFKNFFYKIFKNVKSIDRIIDNSFREFSPHSTFAEKKINDYFDEHLINEIKNIYKEDFKIR